jgi:hypothetical protein
MVASTRRCGTTGDPARSCRASYCFATLKPTNAVPKVPPLVSIGRQSFVVTSWQVQNSVGSDGTIGRSECLVADITVLVGHGHDSVVRFRNIRIKDLSPAR